MWVANPLSLSLFSPYCIQIVYNLYTVYKKYRRKLANPILMCVYLYNKIEDIMNSNYLTPLVEKRLKEIEILLTTLLDEQKELRTYLGGSKPTPLPQLESSISVQMGEYDIKSSWWEKSRFILMNAGKPLTTSDVVAEILKNEAIEDRSSLVRTISNTLNSRKGRQIKRNKVTGKDYSYELNSF